MKYKGWGAWQFPRRNHQGDPKEPIRRKDEDEEKVYEEPLITKTIDRRLQHRRFNGQRGGRKKKKEAILSSEEQEDDAEDEEEPS